MQQITLKIADDYIQNFKNLLKALPQNKVKVFTYVDEIGDTIEVIDGEEFVIPTKEDLKAFADAKKERKVGEYFTIEDIKNERTKYV